MQKKKLNRGVVVMIGVAVCSLMAGGRTITISNLFICKKALVQ